MEEKKKISLTEETMYAQRRDGLLSFSRGLNDFERDFDSLSDPNTIAQRYFVDHLHIDEDKLITDLRLRFDLALEGFGAGDGLKSLARDFEDFISKNYPDQKVETCNEASPAPEVSPRCP